MVVKRVYYSVHFIKQLNHLPVTIISLIRRKENIFRLNPLHPSLRLHQLKGRLTGHWSISIDLNYRLIFKRMSDGNILFISVGKHDIYRSL